MGAGAIDFDGRGYDTMIKPAFDAPLADTDCESCGQCVALCPTGALTERLPIAKNVPLAETLTQSTCVECGKGCDLKYASHGSLLLRALPADLGLLCEKGRFESLNIWRNRIIEPLVNKVASPLSEGSGSGIHSRCSGGAWGSAPLEKMASFEEAVAFIHENIKNYNPQNIAVAISGICTNETIAQLLSFANETLKSDNIYAIKGKGGALPEATEILTKHMNLLPEGNTQGLANAGVNMEDGALKDAVQSGNIKALFAFGDTVPVEWRNHLDLLVLADSAMSDAAEVADVVLPFAAPFETTGTITLQDGQHKQLTAAVPPACGMDAVEMVRLLR